MRQTHKVSVKATRGKRGADPPRTRLPLAYFAILQAAAAVGMAERPANEPLTTDE